MIPETVEFFGRPLPFWIVGLTEGTGAKSFLGGLQCRLKTGTPSSYDRDARTYL